MLLPIGSDEEEQTMSSARQNLAEKFSQSTHIPKKKGHLPRIISIEEDHLPHLLQDYQLAQSPIQECSETLNSVRGQPVGKETSIAVSMYTQKPGWHIYEPGLVACARRCDDDAQRNSIFFLLLHV